MTETTIWMTRGIPWPLTIIRTRYGGTYEGGEWAAITRSEFPDDAEGSDPDCLNFWDDVRHNNGITHDAYGHIHTFAADGRSMSWEIVES